MYAIKPDKINIGTEIRTPDLPYDNPLSNPFGHNPNYKHNHLNNSTKVDFFPSLGKNHEKVHFFA